MNSNKVDIFGVKFDNMTTGEIAGELLEIIGEEARKKPFVVFTPNPEIVMEAQKNSELMGALSAADLISADGIGIVWASGFFGDKIKERASGYDIVQEVFLRGTESGGLSAFFLGGSAAVVEKAAENMEEKYPGLKVSGFRDGYFDKSDSDHIVARINESMPDLLLVGLGSPKQEKWVTENVAALSVKVVIAVGGSFDVMSGSLKRAPVLFQKLGLEWLYRLIRQPRRIKRMMRLPLFAMKVLRYNGKNHKRDSV